MNSEKEMHDYPDTENLPKGGFWIRFLASFIDRIILNIIAVLVVFFTGLGSGLGAVIRGGVLEEALMLSIIMASFINFLVGMAYSVFFVGWSGQTPGKMALKLKIIQINGKEMTYGKAFLRWLGYFLSFPFTLGIGYLMIALSSQKQGLHDKIAGTYVIRL